MSRSKPPPPAHTPAEWAKKKSVDAFFVEGAIVLCGWERNAPMLESEFIAGINKFTDVKVS